ncbi:amino acid adenylation domain-containing protein [Phormidium tenue FACHB-886]|nr:amino acid adenylation domain-containing protein [Phormidium tenue FACHB-886]
MPRCSCFVIGEGAIALECLKILAKTQEILGVYSPDRSLLAWCKAEGVVHSSTRSQFEALLLLSEFDDLFSINNGWIVPQSVLKQARRGTINYHNSPLPKYAGVHATTWAIIHGETEHAITWHEVVEAIDAGRILKQVRFPILPDDTALRVNTRCAEAAIAAFAELAHELAQDRTTPIEQDLRQRSYFGLNDRPAAAAVLDWRQPTETLRNLIRALDFAPMVNPIALPKLWLPGGVVAVTQARSIPVINPQLGQVLALDATGLQVATADGSLWLGGSTTLDGVPLSAADLIDRFGVRIGAVLPLLTEAERKAIERQNAACRHERAWVKHLAELAPFVHPLQAAGNAGQAGRVSVVLPSGKSIESVLAGFAAYCGRLTNAPEFDLAWQPQQRFDANLFAQLVPVRIARRDETFAQFCDRFTETIARTEHLGSYTLDITVRYPHLQNRSRTLPVALLLANSPDALQPPEAALAFVAYRDGSQPELIHSGAIDTADAEAIAGQLQVFITACWEQLQQPMQTLPLLSSAQMQQMLVKWNNTAAAYPSRCIHELIADQATRTPDAIAVRAETQLSYRELDRRSNQLARWLVKLGVASDTLVAVCLPRSVELLIGLLGILKAGGAYVPIDPTYPLDRIEYLLADSRPQTIVTTAALRDRLFSTAESIICLDEQAAILALFGDEPLQTAVAPTDLAYVIYTSGSTGKPKGVEIEHRALVNHSWAIADIYDLTSSDRMLQSASISFDIAGEQIYPTLLQGGTVIMRPDDLLESFDRFTRFIKVQQITAMVLPTAFWHEWVAELVTTGRSVPANLRLLAVGTEKVLAHRLDQWQQLTAGRIVFLQGYGPTEATITCTVYRHDDCPRTTIPIGQPLPNTEAYILDPQLQPVPIGVVGELYIGGLGLARGYHRQRELSDRQFVAHPFRPNARLYKTGDFARFERNGDIVFCERQDHQIKLNGFRIELGEIEAVLNAEPRVKQAIVHPHRVKGKQILVAYVVACEDCVTQLQHQLAQKLPYYMLPTAIVPLDKLPKLPNGKVNRAALPFPAQQAANCRAAAAPLNQIEHQLVQIWQEILELEAIDIHDDFFALGGNSLAAVRLTDRIQTVFRRDVPLATVFQFPSIAQLTEVLRQADETITASSIVALKSGSKRQSLFLLQGIELYRSLAMQLDREQPVYGLAHEMSQQTFDSVAALAAHYIEEIRTVQPRGPYLLGGVSFGGMIALEVAQQLQAAGETVALLALFDTPAPGAFKRRTRQQQLWGHLHNLSHFGWRYAHKKMSEKFDRAACWLAQRSKQRDRANTYRFVRATYAKIRASYQPKAYRGRVALFLATDRCAIKDTVCDPALVEIDPLFGWGKLAVEGVEVYEITGDHLGILKAPQVERLAWQLQRCIDQATMETQQQILITSQNKTSPS